MKEYRSSRRRIETMFESVTKNVKILDLKIEKLSSDFEFKGEFTKVDREQLLFFIALSKPSPNPRFYRNFHTSHACAEAQIVADGQ